MTHAPGRLGEWLEAHIPPDRILRDEPMSRHTSFRIGGPADFVVTVVDEAELAGVRWACQVAGRPFLVIGRGTNLLVRDGGIRGVVVKLGGSFLDMTIAAERKDGLAGHGDGRAGRALAEAGAGVGLAELAKASGEAGLTGLEFAIGIPGTVGGAVVMNAGAYGSEVSRVLHSASFVSPEGAAPFELPARELEFGYRTSRPQREGWTVTRARFALEPGDPDTIRRLEEDYTARRQDKQPLDLPSAGSVFKRPPGRYAGTLIEQSGCKGLRVGDAQVSPKHAGFIVNLGQASAKDVLELIRLVQKAVQAKAGVRLEPEIRIIGED